MSDFLHPVPVELQCVEPDNGSHSVMMTLTWLNRLRLFLGRTINCPTCGTNTVTDKPLPKVADRTIYENNTYYN